MSDSTNYSVNPVNKIDDMMNYVQNAPNTSAELKDTVFEQFMKELAGAVNGEMELTSGDTDLRYSIELQKERLKNKGVKLRYGIKSRGLSSEGMKMYKVWQDAHYKSDSAMYTCEWERNIETDTGKRNKRKLKMDIYETRTDVLDGVNVADDIYVCPDCGAPSPIKELLNGCPYCGDKFQMSELYPKISNYYLVEDASRTGDELKSSIIKYMIGTAIGFLIIVPIVSLIQGKLKSFGIGNLIGLIIGSALGGVVGGYVIWAMRTIVYAFFKAGQSMSMLSSLGSGSRFASYMKRYSPEFSYEYFSGKAISLIKMILYSSDASELPFYLGGPLDVSFKDIVDIVFRGAVTYRGMKEKDGLVHVTVDVFLENTYVRNGSVSCRNERVRAVLVRDVSKPIDYNFSIRKLECPNCQGSFDATKNKVCPFCGGIYKVEESDWAVESLKRS